jgi:predicted flap endonuclease-1-like 5' DNA nuclease
MSWLTEIQDPAALRERATKSLTLPLGMANPLWLAFGAAASAGAAWWLMTRWASPVNLEAFAMPAPKPLETPVALAPPEPEAEPIPDIEPVVEPVMEVAAEAVEEVVDVAEAAVEIAVEMAVAVADDLTRLVGVGPRTAAALAERGVTRFADLAAWTAEDMAAFDAGLNLKGRSVRDAWLAQAKRLAADA